MRARIVLVGLALLAAASGPAWAQPTPEDPLLSYQPEGSSQDPTKLVFSFTVRAEEATRLNIGLSQPAEPFVSVEAEGARDCQTSTISGRPVATCTYDSALPEGTRARATATLSHPYQANGGGLIQLTGAGGSGPLVDVPGPVPGEAADLLASVRIDRDAEARDARVYPGAPRASLFVEFRVHNFGPDTARDVRMTLSSSTGRVNYLPLLLGIFRGCGLRGFEPGAVWCGHIPKDDFNVARDARVPVSAPGRIVASVVASSMTPDPGPRPNQASLEVEATALPDSNFRFTGRNTTVISRVRTAQAGPTISGRATNARTVYVAVARRVDGARVQTSAAGCAWLRNTRGTLRREPGRLCDEPIWVKARGRRSWRLNIRRALPPGSYTVLSRAVAASGVSESAFSRRDGNRIEARIRR